MHRRLISGIVFVAMLMTVVVSPAAAASGPTRSFLGDPGSLTFGPGNACAFPVRLDFLIDREYGVFTTDSSGNLTQILVSGRLVVGLTNLSNGHSIVVDISGPGEYDFHPDGSFTTILRGNSIPVVPGKLYLTTGTVVQDYAPDGSLVSTTRATGTQTDLCPQFA